MRAPLGRYKAQQGRIDEFVRFHSLPHFLRRKLHRYNKFLFNVNRGFDVGQIAAALPGNLRRDVLFHMHQKLVTSVPLFDVCNEHVIKGLVCVLKPQVGRLGSQHALRPRPPPPTLVRTRAPKHAGPSQAVGIPGGFCKKCSPRLRASSIWVSPKSDASDMLHT